MLTLAQRCHCVVGRDSRRRHRIAHGDPAMKSLENLPCVSQQGFERMPGNRVLGHQCRIDDGKNDLRQVHGIARCVRTGRMVPWTLHFIHQANKVRSSLAAFDDHRALKPLKRPRNDPINSQEHSPSLTVSQERLRRREKRSVARCVHCNHRAIHVPLSVETRSVHWA